MKAKSSKARPSQKATPRTRRVNNDFAKFNEAPKGQIKISHMEVEDQGDWEHLHWDQKENMKEYSDRFIPLRRNCITELSPCIESTEDAGNDQRGRQVQDQKINLDQMYRCVLLNKNTHKMLKFGHSHQNTTHSSILQQIQQNSAPKYFKEESHFVQEKLHKRLIDPDYRKINKSPYKVLAAPNLQDDFYLNLLQWSSHDLLAVALDKSLYFWNANDNKVAKFCDVEPEAISSLSWNAEGTQIAIGSSNGTVQLWDVAKNCKVNDYSGHGDRVSSVAWGNGLLASGSRDRSILLRDFREGSKHMVSKLEGHELEVCSLKWSFDQNMLASGANDNKLLVWSMRSMTSICKFTAHHAAVKAIAWNPHNHGVLASGGGTADRTIKFWNTLQDSLIDSIDTGSQVCSLVYSKNTKELVSTHGYSNNQIIIWRYQTLQKSTTLLGHTSRVLFSTLSPDGESIVTGAGDETLRFWHVFPAISNKAPEESVLSSVEDLR